MSPESDFVPVKEYLRTLYRPDCDYVDGVLVDRNVGLLTHQMAVREALFYFYDRRLLWDVFVILSVRMRISRTRYRVPDVLAILGPEPDEQIVTKPPFLCIEVLSPDDRLSQTQEKIDDYLRFGVRFVWLIDPFERRAWVYTADDISEVRDGLSRTEDPELIVQLAEVLG